jgi:hypothetical protein
MKCYAFRVMERRVTTEPGNFTIYRLAPVVHNKNSKTQKSKSLLPLLLLCTRDLILSRELISSDTDHHPI